MQWNCVCEGGLTSPSQQGEAARHVALGSTPLHIAARYGHTETATQLVKLGADVGAKNIVCWWAASLRVLPPPPLVQRNLCNVTVYNYEDEMTSVSASRIRGEASGYILVSSPLLYSPLLATILPRRTDFGGVLTQICISPPPY